MQHQHEFLIDGSDMGLFTQPLKELFTYLGKFMVNNSLLAIHWYKSYFLKISMAG